MFERKKMVIYDGMFNPYDYLLQMTTADDKPFLTDDGGVRVYLPVDAQILWFRTVYPQGSIMTEEISRDDGYVEFKASVYTDNMPDKLPLAVAHFERLRDDGIYSSLESAESLAIGRALRNAGFGTQIELQALQEMQSNALNRLKDEEISQSEEKAEDVKKIPEPAKDVVEPKVVEADPLEVLGVEPPDKKVASEEEGLEQSAELNEADADSSEKSEDEPTVPHEDLSSEAEESEQPVDQSVSKTVSSKKSEEESEVSQDVEKHTKKSADSKKKKVDNEDSAKDTNEEDAGKESNGADYIIRKSDCTDDSLFVHIGRAVSEIEISDLILINQHIRDKLSKGLLAAIDERLKEVEKEE